MPTRSIPPVMSVKVPSYVCIASCLIVGAEMAPVNAAPDTSTTALPFCVKLGAETGSVKVPCIDAPENVTPLMLSSCVATVVNVAAEAVRTPGAVKTAPHHNTSNVTRLCRTFHDDGGGEAPVMKLPILYVQIDMVEW